MIERHPYVTLDGFIDQLNMSSANIAESGFLPGGIGFQDTQSIICGTFPPQREYINRKGYVHYSSCRNKFWKHIDNLYQTNLYIPSKISNNEILRIENAIQKIRFLKSNKLGFVDIYTKINRKVDGSAQDRHINKIETIFDLNTFKNLLDSKHLLQIIFPYSASRTEFCTQFFSEYQTKPILLRKYKTDGFPLEIEIVKVDNKQLFLTYTPIHGRISDALKRKALNHALRMNFGHFFCQNEF